MPNHEEIISRIRECICHREATISVDNNADSGYSKKPENAP
jgi:hypothetical protein